MEQECVLLTEAPCGSGKGFAYAVPAIERAQQEGKRTVIVTANIALQSQLIEKDLPALATALPGDFTFALLKGRSNFYCPEKATRTDAARSVWGPRFGQMFGLTSEQVKRVEAGLAWGQVTPTGDRESFPDDVVAPASEDGVWHLLSAGEGECLGNGCSFAREGKCWANNHRTAAQQAQIIVTNYHVLYAHAKICGWSASQGILPQIDNLVLDEAHEAARIAREFFGIRISYARFRRIAELLKHSLAFSDRQTTRFVQSGQQLIAAIEDYYHTMEYRAWQYIHRPNTVDVEYTLNVLETIGDQVSSIAADAERSKDYETYNKAMVATRRIVALTTDVHEVFREPSADKVYWIEVSKDHPTRVEGRYLDVADVFRSSVRPLTQSLTLTSATLTAAGSFDLVRSELGISDAMTYIAESPFDFHANTRLVVMSEEEIVPASKNREAFNEATLPVYEEIFDFWSGRILCLFTAKTDLDWLHAKLANQGERNVFKQGDAPRPQLAQWFREDPQSILMGVDSFWTGIDVPGPKAIIIHKLPFPYPDVVLKAIQRRLPQDVYFKQRYYPWMITKLKQGCGRLLRRRGDYGFIVCMDRRMTDKWAYASLIRRSLPFGEPIRTDELYLLEPFLKQYDDQAEAVAV
jgi:ATP-dependent DNA helicase DinG